MMNWASWPLVMAKLELVPTDMGQRRMQWVEAEHWWSRTARILSPSSFFHFLRWWEISSRILHILMWWDWHPSSTVVAPREYFWGGLSHPYPSRAHPKRSFHKILFPTTKYRISSNKVYELIFEEPCTAGFRHRISIAGWRSCRRTWRNQNQRFWRHLHVKEY